LRHHPLAVAIATVALLSVLQTASAHGPAPVALEVLAHDGEVPTLLRTNLGLARSAGDGTYEYICPSRWDGNELFLAEARAGGEEILVHSAGVAYLSSDAGCTFSALTGDELYVTDAAETQTGFVFIAEDYPDDVNPESSHVFEWAEGALRELSLPVPGAIDGVVGLVPEPGFLVSGHRPETFVADETGRLLLSAGPPTSRLTPRAATGAEVWLRALVEDGVSLWRVSDGEATPTASATIIHGPVYDGTRWLALIDGAVHEFVGTWRPLGDVDWTCLRSHAGRSFACSLIAMQELGGPGPLPTATPVFSTLQFGPPRACGESAAQLACERDWAHFGGEPGWLDTLPATSPTGDRRAPGGCSVTAGRDAGFVPWSLLFAAIVLMRRRRR